ncbi:hypothetical protein BH11ACT4_BH11ACT4_20170 [soil metagenome]
MTDERPRPRYGEYAPIPPAGAPLPPPPPTVEPVAPAAARRPGDVFITTALLMLGVIDVVTGYSQFTNLADTLRATYAAQGFPAFTSDALANSMGTGINIARVAILVVTVIVSLLRIRLHRRAFWVPLAGAGLAALVVIVCVLVVILHDPAFAQYVATQSSAG